MSGWIKLHRKMQRRDDYFAEQFCKNMAWIDMLWLANHKTKKILVRGIYVDIKRGQTAYAEDTLAERWQWSRGKVRRFLAVLENRGQIVQQKNNIITLITITNYEEYQGNDTTDSTTNGQQTDTNKNDKTLKNETIKTIVEYLNIKTNSSYKHTAAATSKHIEARLNEKFTVDDFRAVIDVKCGEWMGNKDMEQYLRPQTLFGTKFESYLQQTKRCAAEVVAW